VCRLRRGRLIGHRPDRRSVRIRVSGGSAGRDDDVWTHGRGPADHLRHQSPAMLRHAPLGTPQLRLGRHRVEPRPRAAGRRSAAGRKAHGCRQRGQPHRPARGAGSKPMLAAVPGRVSHGGKPPCGAVECRFRPSSRRTQILPVHPPTAQPADATDDSACRCCHASGRATTNPSTAWFAARSTFGRRGTRRPSVLFRIPETGADSASAGGSRTLREAPKRRQAQGGTVQETTTKRDLSPSGEAGPILSP